MNQNYNRVIAKSLGYKPDDLIFKTADGGHMAYRRQFVTIPKINQTFFIKGHDQSLFTDSNRSKHAKEYLKKEAMLFNYLRQQGYKNIPDKINLVEDSYLTMEALLKEAGWYWRAPRDNPKLLNLYIRSVLKSLDDLQKIPVPNDDHFFPKRIMDVLIEEGWGSIDASRISKIRKSSQALRNNLYPNTEKYFDEFLQTLPSLVTKGQSLYSKNSQLYLSHHDARQANIAWHPKYGTRNLDLSWMDVGWEKADNTMLLIDLAKANHDVSRYLKNNFNADHALLLLGHWISRSAEPSNEANPIVRLHQLAAAITSYKLLNETNDLILN